jgi:ankyrin repeat protein
LDQSEYDLLQLMRKQKFRAVKEILSTNTINVKQIRDQDGQTLLHLAAWRNQTAIAERLLALGADLNVKDHVGYTPLHEAVRSGSRGCTELYLKNNADLATVDNSGNSPLETAIYYGCLDLAKMLVRHGAKVDLCTASALGLVDQVRTFLDQETAQHPQRNDSANSQPNQEPEFSIQFTSSRIRFSPFGTATPLHCAARGGSVEVASLLVSRGASISALDGQGRTPLFWAVEAGRLETARFLIEHGAEVNGTNLSGSTPLLTASRDTVSPELIGFLIKAGADVKTTDAQGENGLHKLAWYGYLEKNIETAQILFDAGADITSRNNDGKTPLDILLDNSFQNPNLVKLYRKYAAKAQSESGK